MLATSIYIHAINSISRGKLKVNVKNLKSNNGFVLIYLYDDKKGFLKNLEKASFYRKASIKNKQSTCVFESLPTGIYAAIAIHDDYMKRFYNPIWNIPKTNIGLPNNNYRTNNLDNFIDCSFCLTKGTTEVEILMNSSND